jgi:hypothetical protein
MAITKLVITGNTTAVGISSTPITISLAHKAQSTSVVPDDNITATNVQDALEQLDDIKAPIASPDFTGTATMDGLTVDGSATIRDAVSPSLRFLDTNAVNSDFTLYSPDGNNSLRIKAGSSQTDAFSIASSGDISFYEDTGTAPKFFWDSSAESLGIGTTSFTSKFHVGGNMTDHLYSEPTGDSIATFAPITTGSSSAMNVNIGSGMYGGAGVETARLNFLNGHGNDGFATGFSIKSYKTASATATDEYLAFEEIRRAGNTGVTHNERMRIDSSGNLLVGTTNTTPFANSANSSSDNGIALRSDGILAVAAYKSTANSGNVVTANRTGTDGSIIGLQKSGTTVGSIGTLASHPYFVSSSRGIRITNSEVLPCTSTGTTSDNTMDLGSTFGHFKDLHLSGTGYFGTKVGIGTTSPDSKLHVRGSSSGATGVADGTLIVEQGSAPSIQILSANSQTQTIKFGDPEDGDVGKISYSHATNNMAFNTDGTERMRIDSSGVVHVYEGIDFGGAVNSGGTVSSSNKLDDYEEGTWTPVASGYNETGAIMTVNSAAYTKIGRLVHLRASVTFSDTADGSIIQISGVPFAQGSASTGRGGSVTRDTSGSVAFTDGSTSTVLRMLSNTHSTVTYTAVRGATVEFFHIYDA